MYNNFLWAPFIGIMRNSITNENFDGHLGLRTKDQDNFHKATKIKIAKSKLSAGCKKLFYFINFVFQQGILLELSKLFFVVVAMLEK